MLRILFMGTPDFAKESLEALYRTNNEIIGVVTNIDKPKGRGMKMIPTPVKEFALKENLKIYQPEKIKNNFEFIKEIKQLKPDLICVIAYGKILPKEILDIPKLGCINVHGSLLPKYRGAAPIQWSVINGDKKTGITTMYMNEGMDTGDIILKEEVEIAPDETTGELWERLSKTGANLLVKTIELIEKGIAPRIPQIGEFSTAPMLKKEIAEIKWKDKTAIEIKNLVRGLNPIMGAYTYFNNKKYKFWKVEVIENNEFLSKFKEISNIEDKEPGTILIANDKQGMYIKAIDNIILVKEIQGENSKKMNINDFLRGNKI